MTDPTNALRALITYAVCIALAITVGYLLTDPMDYGTLGIFGIIAMTLLSPFVIKWYYPLLVFGLASPIYCFFLPGDPPLNQVVAILCLGVAIISRTINTEKRFISVPMVTWPLLYTIAMAYGTAKLTGGIGLHSVGANVGGGKKYIALFTGCMAYFALVSYAIPQKKRNFYVALFFLTGILSFISDLFAYLPKPLSYINLLIPPNTEMLESQGTATSRLGAFASAAGAGICFMLAKYGLRGIFRADKPARAIILMLLGVVTLFGGFRISLVTYLMMATMLFFLEGLHRTKMLMVFGMLVIACLTLLGAFSRDLPYSFQRSLTVFPFLKLDPEAVLDADGSKEWREAIWRDTWPKVPEYLFLGKGYALTASDFQGMGAGALNGLDQSENGLAISMDYHNGPLSTLMPFGIWGMLSFLWIATASLWCTYRNMRYGDPELKTVNTFFFAGTIQHIFGYFFLFGAFDNDVGQFMQVVGFSIALNWGVRGAKPRTVAAIQTKPVRAVQLLPAKSM